MLEVLYAHASSVHLRYVATLSQCPVRAVQVALESLQADRLVKRVLERGRPRYLLNRKHSAYPLLSKVFEASQAAQIQTKSERLNPRAEQFIPFIETAVQMIQSARASTRVTR